jgi:hypothetical protein
MNALNRQAFDGEVPSPRDMVRVIGRRHRARGAFGTT